jgi:hypothetical protein
MEISKGIDPTISITANKVNIMVNSWSKCISIKKALYEDTKLFEKWTFLEKDGFY